MVHFSSLEFYPPLPMPLDFRELRYELTRALIVAPRGHERGPTPSRQDAATCRIEVSNQYPEPYRLNASSDAYSECINPHHHPHIYVGVVVGVGFECSALLPPLPRNHNNCRRAPAVLDLQVDLFKPALLDPKIDHLSETSSITDGVQTKHLPYLYSHPLGGLSIVAVRLVAKRFHHLRDQPLVDSVHQGRLYPSLDHAHLVALPQIHRDNPVTFFAACRSQVRLVTVDREVATPIVEHICRGAFIM